MPCVCGGAQGIEATDNETYGVCVEGGVAVDLSRAVMVSNNWNGLNVSHVTLPGARASITLAGVHIRGNGADGNFDASEARYELHGVVFEADAAGVTRESVLVRATQQLPAVFVFGNAGGDWAHVKDDSGSGSGSGN
jgi:hypothetical protein